MNITLDNKNNCIIRTQNMALPRCIVNFSSKKTGCGLILSRARHEGPRGSSCGESGEKPPCPPCPPPNRPPCIKKKLPNMYEVEVNCKAAPAGQGAPCPCEQVAGGKDCTNRIKTSSIDTQKQGVSGPTRTEEERTNGRKDEICKTQNCDTKPLEVDKSIFETFGGGVWGNDGRNYRSRDGVPSPKINKRKTMSDKCSPNRGNHLNPCMNNPTVKTNILRAKQKESLSSRIMKNLGIDGYTKTTPSPTAQSTRCVAGMKAGSKEWCNKPGLVKPGPIKCKPQTLAERLMRPPERKLHTKSVNIVFDTAAVARALHTTRGNSMPWYTKTNKTSAETCKTEENINKNILKKCSCPSKSKLKYPLANNKRNLRPFKPSGLSCQSSEQLEVTSECDTCPIITLFKSLDTSGCERTTGSCCLNPSGACPLKALLSPPESRCPLNHTKKCPLRAFLNASDCKCGRNKCPLKALIDSLDSRCSRLPWQNTDGYKICPVLPQEEKTTEFVKNVTSNCSTTSGTSVKVV